MPIRMVEVIDDRSRLVLINPAAVDAVALSGEGRQKMTLYLRGGHAVPLRDDYGSILFRGLWGDVSHILDLEVTPMHPGDLHKVRADELDQKPK